MASKEKLIPFEKEGQADETYPYHENIPEGAIKLWTPPPGSLGDYRMRLKLEKEFANDENSWYGQYTDLGGSWDESVKDFFSKVKMDYIEEIDCLRAREIPDIFPKSGWKIIEFGLARFTGGNLISRVKWEHPDGKRFMTAYSWPGCG